MEEGSAMDEDEEEMEEEDNDAEESSKLYFTQPQQLLDIFAELEENNLLLIQTCQETDATLDELHQKISETETRM